MALHVVLVEPAIPQNTGNIARLTAGTNAVLHLIEPLGFSIDDKQVKRAGLDYWPEVSLEIHASWQVFLEATKVDSEQLWFFSTKAERPYTEVSYSDNDYLVFGSEIAGLPDWYHQEYPIRRVKIPIANSNIRSFNLANATAIALFEAQRQLGLSKEKISE